MQTSTTLITWLVGSSLSDWFIAVGTIGAAWAAFYFGIKSLNELKEQKSSGFAIGDIDPTGIGTLYNQSQIDYIFRLSKYVIAGTRLDRALELNSILDSANKSISKRQEILAKIREWKLNEEEILPEQTISPKESLAFHILNISDDVVLAFVLLQLRANRKTKFYLYRYANRQRIDFLSNGISDSLHPYNRWIRIFSFEEDEIIIEGLPFRLEEKSNNSAE